MQSIVPISESDAGGGNGGTAHSDDDATAAAVGARIIEAREAHDLSTAQLARRLGVKTRTLTGWEHGVSEPRANRLTMLAGLLGVSPTWLLTGRGESPDADSTHVALAGLRARLSDLKRQAESLVEEIDRIAASVPPGDRH